MAALPPIGIVLATQSLGSLADVFAQREVRVVHLTCNTRSVISISIYSALQAFVVLTIVQLALPQAITDGQGPLTIWKPMSEHPAAVLLLTFINVPYWLALCVLFQLPLGGVLVVLSYLLAGFMVGPISLALGLEDAAPPDPLAIALAVIGVVVAITQFQTTATSSCIA